MKSEADVQTRLEHYRAVMSEFRRMLRDVNHSKAPKYPDWVHDAQFISSQIIAMEARIEQLEWVLGLKEDLDTNPPA